jgi:hypothetical protein
MGIARQQHLQLVKAQFGSLLVLPAASEFVSPAAERDHPRVLLGIKPRTSATRHS